MDRTNPIEIQSQAVQTCEGNSAAAKTHCVRLDSIPTLLRQIEAASSELAAPQDQRAVALAMVVEKRLIEILDLTVSTTKHIQEQPASRANGKDTDHGGSAMIVRVVEIGTRPAISLSYSPLYGTFSSGDLVAAR